MTQPTSSTKAPALPVFPDSSADWRFLLPITRESRLLVVGGGQDDFSDLFGKIGVSSVSWVTDAAALSVLSPSSFDIIAFPLGLPRREAVWQTIRRLLHPGGTLLFGFSNLHGPYRGGQPGSLQANPWLLLFKLRQAGYSQVELFGAMPNLNAPETIFPLGHPALNFTLQNRYRYKLPASMLKFVFHRSMSGLLSNFIPHYLVVAKRDDGPASGL